MQTGYFSVALTALINFTIAEDISCTNSDAFNTPAWNNVMNRYGYSYETYSVTTDDDWTLTLFRITGRQDEEVPEDGAVKQPVYLQHGALMDAASWIELYDDDVPMPLQLVDEGFDVWMGNNRGTRYSNTRTSQIDGRDADRYDFDFFDMGVSDLPAFIDKIIDLTNSTDITYIGYDQGTTQLLYGLTQKQDYFSQVLRKAILLAPCLYVTSLGPQTYKQVYPIMRREQISAVNDNNWSEILSNLCDTNFADTGIACSYASSFSGEVTPLKSLEHFDQMAITGTFTEYLPDFSETDFARPQPVQPGLESVNDLQIQLVVADRDEQCTLKQAQRIMDQTPAVSSLYQVRNMGHVSVAKAGAPSFMVALLDQIEKPTEKERKRNGSVELQAAGGVAVLMAFLASI